jgi:excisionase family DNA binding protein
MDEVLTVRQVQSLLKVDRITVYRMLKDGRLSGIKIGHEWRFPRRDVSAFISSAAPSSTLAEVAAGALPLHCIQLIQNVFADVAEVGAVTCAPGGVPVTEVSNPCRFCALMLASPSGRVACSESWRKAEQPPVAVESGDPGAAFTRCHAGLSYACSAIGPQGNPIASILAGQFFVDAPDPQALEDRVRLLAEQHNIDPRELLAAAEEIRTLDERKRAQLGHWLDTVARTFTDIGRERAELVGRLRDIAAMTVLDKAPVPQESLI